MKVPGRGRLLAVWTPPPLRAAAHMWEGMVSRRQLRHAEHARSHVLHALAPGQHRHHRLRLHRAARRKRAAGARLHAAQRTRPTRLWPGPSRFPSRRSSSASTIGLSIFGTGLSGGINSSRRDQQGARVDRRRPLRGRSISENAFKNPAAGGDRGCGWPASWRTALWRDWSTHRRAAIPARPPASRHLHC